MNTQERTHHISKTGIAAATKLVCFLERKMELQESHADACIETLIELIELVRDESYRLKKDA